ncbi:MAG: putative hydrolase or acyltransferase of alpha/beta superfamily [Deltaproteobacteria bacterium]|nr:putative hydrolase or acyltransferase of alpha/beta superfamily [Deltaproteobacteria bacterium]
MPVAILDGVDIYYEAEGELGGRPIVLIPGLGDQLIWWDETFVTGLVSRGYRVLRCDPRDVGHSTKFDKDCPDPWDGVRQIRIGQPFTMPYSIDDMASDIMQLIASLGLPTAHIMGNSLGGAIARSIALNAPHQVRSLITVGTHTGNLDIPATVGMTAALEDLLVAPVPRTRDAFIDYRLQVLRSLSGPTPPFSERYHIEREGLAFERSEDSLGRGRQTITAMLDTEDRSAALKSLKVPSLFVYGAFDVFTPPEAAADYRRLVPHARIELLLDAGHVLGTGHIPTLLGLVLDFLETA